jgi:hypothetical protein
VPNQSNGQIIVWLEGSTTPTKSIRTNLLSGASLLVTTSGDIYTGIDGSLKGVSKWTLKSTNGVPIMYTCGECLGFFVDISNTLYCSMGILHQVVAKSLNTGSNAFSVVAGNGSVGSASNMLDWPWGIFVDTNFDLYVADYRNSRIQRFRPGEVNAITVAGNTSLTTTITLNWPSGIVLDADKYLFIADTLNNRIVGSGPNGFRCLVGCSGIAGAASNQLIWPYSLSFDSYGNIFVTDTINSRIQKFLLQTKLYSKLNNNETVKEKNLFINTTTETRISAVKNGNRIFTFFFILYYINKFFYSIVTNLSDDVPNTATINSLKSMFKSHIIIKEIYYQNRICFFFKELN